MYKPEKWKSKARPDMLCVENPLELGTLITSADTKVEEVSAPDCLFATASLPYFETDTEGITDLLHEGLGVCMLTRINAALTCALSRFC